MSASTYPSTASPPATTATTSKPPDALNTNSLHVQQSTHVDQMDVKKGDETFSPRPVIDTHIHVYRVTRPGGVPWPPSDITLLYRDVTPSEYHTIATQHGIISTGIMEASPLLSDNYEILEWIKDDPFFIFFIPQLAVGSDNFLSELDKLAQNPRVVGIRSFLWDHPLTLDKQQIQHLQELAKRGMTLDSVSRATLNPKEMIHRLATLVPDLRIIVDHLAGAKGVEPTAEWISLMRQLATHPNIYIKWSSIFNLFNPQPSGVECTPWESPITLSSYTPHFDMLYELFGPNRLIWGSNWPVSELGGTLKLQIALAEEYLANKGHLVRDQIMYKNAQQFYTRIIKEAARSPDVSSPAH